MPTTASLAEVKPRLRCGQKYYLGNAFLAALAFITKRETRSNPIQADLEDMAFDRKRT